MYASLQLPWSLHPSPAECKYRAAGLVKTKGTIPLLPPTNSSLEEAYRAPPRPVSRMSAGAVALCKHFERGGASSEKGRPHPFWTLPTGSNEDKNRIAVDILAPMLADAVWRNVMLLHPGVAVYEVRNRLGYGMRWTLDVAGKEMTNEPPETADSSTGGGYEVCGEAHGGSESWMIVRTIFRGFLEPVIGLDHELPG